MLLLRFNTSIKLRLYAHSTPLCAIRGICPFLLHSTSSVLPTQACTRTRTCSPRILYTCRDSAVSVFPLGSTTTDTAFCAMNTANAADAGTPRSLMYAVPSIESYQRHQHQRRPVSRSPASGLVVATSPRDKWLRTNVYQTPVPSSICSGHVFIRVSPPFCVNHNARKRSLFP